MDNNLEGLVQSVEQKYALHSIVGTELAEQGAESKRYRPKAPSLKLSRLGFARPKNV